VVVDEVVEDVVEVDVDSVDVVVGGSVVVGLAWTVIVVVEGGGSKAAGSRGRSDMAYAAEKMARSVSRPRTVTPSAAAAIRLACAIPED